MRTLYQAPPPAYTHDIQGNELELIVGSTVDKSDVVLAFIG